MKKHAIILFLAVLFAALSACGEASENQPKTPPSEPTVTVESSLPEEDAESDNPLLRASFFTDNVLSGSGEKIGTYGYIMIEKSALPDLYSKEFSTYLSEFANKRVRDSGYNWVSVFFEDETGLCFAGSNTIVADYGNMDNEGCITTWLDAIIISTSSESDNSTTRSIPNPTLQQSVSVPSNSFEPVDEIIFSTYASENGLQDTPFYADGTIEEFFEAGRYNTFRLSTDYGDLYISEMFVPLPELEVGDHVTVFFLYTGWSEVIGGPAGPYIYHE